MLPRDIAYTPYTTLSPPLSLPPHSLVFGGIGGRARVHFDGPGGGEWAGASRLAVFLQTNEYARFKYLLLNVDVDCCLLYFGGRFVVRCSLSHSHLTPELSGCCGSRGSPSLLASSPFPPLSPIGVL